MVAALIEQAGLKLPEDPLTLEGEDCEHSYWPNGTICIWCGDQKVREEPYPGHPDVEFTPGRVEGVAGWTGGIKPSEKIVVPKPELSPQSDCDLRPRPQREICPRGRQVLRPPFGRGEEVRRRGGREVLLSDQEPPRQL
jgi:hypothetical protein